ncbi:ABC transporter substrate-binding protein [Pelomonas sp. KK5]|uniref:substrate-binding periplasmic protein n=1 Tax=Pelomonas sp. KK5 TaxID=1855730 RepID=UPI00097C0F64|nr:transporter substrate-binding domain-containing protein [Pelomonas sp. KK5]
MIPPQLHRRTALLLLLGALGVTPAARAACSRPVQIPVAPIGVGVTVDNGKVGGIYPDLLRSAAGAEGCEIRFQVVPRARQELMFETGLSDILLPARRSPRRDEFGTFFPLIQSRAALVSLERDGGHAPLELHSLAELQQRHELRLAVVRGYDYGEAYQALLRALGEQGRLQQAADPISLVRLLDAGVADLAIVAPTIVSGALRGDERHRALAARLHVETVDELGWGESGVYLSRRSRLNARDREQLTAMLVQMSKSGAAWREFQRNFPEDTLKLTVRPR